MKTRDCIDVNQEFVYSDSGLYAYIGVTDAEVTNQMFAGINEVGFAIINSNAYNFEDTVAGPADDGYIIRQALESCQTVTDFQTILDSTNITGRTLPAVYGVIDAFGGGIFYEAAAGEYFIYDWNDSTAAPNGYMVRTTFAYNGDPHHNAQFRHDRALTLIDSAFAEGILDRRFLAQTVMRDLNNSFCDPYPLPYQGQLASLSYGFINTNIEDIINRWCTHSTQIIQGIEPGEDPELMTLWVMAGQPITSVALPLWVHAGSVPVELNGPESDLSALNLKSQEIRGYLYPLSPAYPYLDTWRLVDQWGGGLLPFLLELEEYIAVSGDSAWNEWSSQGLPGGEVVADFQNSLASYALEELNSWGPPQAPEVSLHLLADNQVLVDWLRVTLNVFELPIEVSSYTVYGSAWPFSDRLVGDSLTTVDSPPVILDISENWRFFQVRCRP
jgi:hypothetical protein